MPQSIGTIYIVNHIIDQPSITTVLADTQLVFNLQALQTVYGSLFIMYYVSGGGGFTGQISVDNAPLSYAFAPTLKNMTNVIQPFNGLGVSAIQAYQVNFAITANLTTPVRVQFAQQVVDAANPTYVLHGSYIALSYQQG